MTRHVILKLLTVTVVFLGFNFCDSLYGETGPNKKIKVAVIYTGSSPQLIADTEGEIMKQLGPNVEILRYKEPGILDDTLKAGYVTPKGAARLITVYMEAVDSGADAILSVCSTVGDAAYSMQDAAKFLGVPIIIINEEMCREAVRKGSRIAIMATLSSSIAPTKNIINRVAREMGKHVEVTEVCLDGGYGSEPEKLKALMASKAAEIVDKVDVIVFSQGSMAYCEEYLVKTYNKTVLSNPRFGAAAVKTALIAKGYEF